MKCEACQTEHDGTYGSGRFCSCKCARGFSTRAKRDDINRRVSLKLKGDSRCAWNKGRRGERSIKAKLVKLICRRCNREYELMLTPCEIKSRRFCSLQCAEESRRNAISTINKSTYQNGRIVRGGTTRWFTYKDIRVQGTYELRACYILDAWKECGKIKDWEYTNDRISYHWPDGSEHTYLLDFKLQYPNGSVVYLETKGYTRENDHLKWEAMKRLGLELMIWFKDDLEREESLLKI